MKVYIVERTVSNRDQTRYLWFSVEEVFTKREDAQEYMEAEKEFWRSKDFNAYGHYVNDQLLKVEIITSNTWQTLTISEREVK